MSFTWVEVLVVVEYGIVSLFLTPLLGLLELLLYGVLLVFVLHLVHPPSPPLRTKNVRDGDLVEMEKRCTCWYAAATI